MSAARIVAAFGCLALAAIGCGRGRAARPAETDAAAALTYGFGPDPNASVKYQPDVVVIEGGPGAIRSASADGMTWVIDGRARGARDLAPGKVMFATSRAVGRVIALRPAGDDLAVTVAPAGLTEVVREASIDLAQELVPDSVAYQGSAEGDVDAALQPAVWMPGVGPSGDPVPVITTPTLRLVGAEQPEPPMPSAVKASYKVRVRDWEMEPYLKFDSGAAQSTKRLGLKVNRVAPGLKFGGDVSLFARTLRFRARLPVRDGHVGSYSFVIEGIDGLDVSLLAGVTNGLRDNQKVRVEVPIEIVHQIPPSPATAGLPLAGQMKFKWIVETAFSAKNSTLSARGRYRLQGPVGYEDGALLGPKMDVADSLLKSIEGVSVGANGMVFVCEIRALIGLGTTAAMAGPYTKVVFSVGVWRGSDLAAPLVVCKGAFFRADAGAGAGLQVSKALAGPLQDLLGKEVRAEWEVAEKLATLWNRKAVSPDIPICR